VPVAINGLGIQGCTTSACMKLTMPMRIVVQVSLLLVTCKTASGGRRSLLQGQVGQAWAASAEKMVAGKGALVSCLPVSQPLL